MHKCCSLYIRPTPVLGFSLSGVSVLLPGFFHVCTSHVGVQKHLLGNVHAAALNGEVRSGYFHTLYTKKNPTFFHTEAIACCTKI